MSKYFLVGLYVAIAIACCTVSVYADQDYLSFPRVGNEFDSTELAYYGLFQKVDSVRSVQVLRVSADSLDLVVHFNGKDDQTLRYGNYLAEHIERYVTNYETLTTEYLELHANALLKFVRVHTFSRRGPELRFELCDKSIVKGELLYVNDSCCILMKSKSKWHYTMDDSNFIFLRYNQIEKLLDSHYPYVPIALMTAVAVVSTLPSISRELPSEASSLGRTTSYVIAAATLAGVVSSMVLKDYYGSIEANQDLFRQEVAAGFESSYFSDYPSPEMMAALRRHTFPTSVKRENPPIPSQGYSRFNINISSSTLSIGSNFNTQVTWNGYENGTITGGTISKKSYNTNADIDMCYRLNYRWGISGGFSSYKTESIDSVFAHTIDVSSSKIRVGIDFVAVPAHASPSGQTVEAHLRIEPTLLLVNRPAFDFHHAFIYEGVDTLLHVNEFSKVALGLRLCQLVEFYPSSLISLGFQLEELLGPTLSMSNPGVKTTRFGRRNELIVDDTQFEATSFYAAFRLGVHF